MGIQVQHNPVSVAVAGAGVLLERQPGREAVVLVALDQQRAAAAALEVQQPIAEEARVCCPGKRQRTRCWLIAHHLDLLGRLALLAFVTPQATAAAVVVSSLPETSLAETLASVAAVAGLGAVQPAKLGVVTAAWAAAAVVLKMAPPRRPGAMAGLVAVAVVGTTVLQAR
jgi:hypothetical protein